MAEGVLGLGTGQASTLNQELIDKLKAAERKSSIEPIETDLSDWELESVKLQEITLYANDMLDAIKPFDLFITSGTNAFEDKSATTTGESVVFDAVDAGSLNTGTTTVNITSLAQRDVYQSATFSDKTAFVSSTSGHKISVNGVEFSLLNKSYEDLASEINLKSDFNASVEQVGTDSFRLVIKSENSGTDNALEIIETGTDLGFNSFTSENSIYSLESASDTFGVSATGSTVLTGNTSIILTSNGTDTELSISSGTTLTSLVSSINDLAGYSASINASGAISITSDDGYEVTIDNNDSGLDFSKILDDGLSLVIGGETFTSSNESADDFIARINSDSNFEASIDGNGIVSIRNADGSTLDVTSDDLNLGLVNNNHTLHAQNLEATIDGVDYNVSSNAITVDGGLKITAVKEGTSTISIEKDTTQITTLVESFVEKYNTLMETIDTELYSSDSEIVDKNTLRTLVGQVKEFLFNNYGANSDLNLFNYGFSVDSNGTLSLDATTFNTAVSDDYDNLKNLFIGSAENEGLGTQLKEYVDSLDGYQGLLTAYEDNMDIRKTNLEEELENSTEDLDNKYAQLSQQFADYATIITRFNSQFAGLEMMIEQSISG